MGKLLRRWLKQSAAMPPGLDAMLNLFVAGKLIENDFEEMLRPFGVTRRQFNVLRILKGVHPDGHPRSEIAARVLEQSPDITRIIDRLEEQGYLTRKRGTKDKRESLSVITTKGINIVEKINPHIEQFTKSIEKTLTPTGCEMLSELCEKLYSAKVPEA
ncbi:MAG: MarR family transcriptional regulator [Ignavibacteriota bacterium]